jgi:hypothetical protein
MTLKKDSTMNKDKVIPILLHGTKIGNIHINKNYLDIIECDKVELNLEYKKSNMGKRRLLNLLVAIEKG